MKSWIADPQALALSLQATVLSHARVREAATAFASELAAGRGCTRVSVGFVRNGLVELHTMSHGSNEDLRRPAFNNLAAAMDEAVQQGLSVYWPAEGAPAIRLAHRALLIERGGAVATVPIVHLGHAVGAVCCEWTTQPANLPALVAEIENHVSLAGPVLHLMRQRELPWHQRWRDAARRRMQRLRQGQGRGLAAGLVLGVAALAAVLALPVEHRVGGRARVQGEQQRSVAAPQDGYLKAVHARPGDRVQKDQLLLELADQELVLQQRKWASDLAQQENAYASAQARSERAAMVIALARADEARAQLALIDTALARTRITAPFASVVVEGDLSQALGAPVERGRQLMVLAPLDRYRVIVQVDERDIARVQAGQQGELSLSALPWDTLPVRVQRITALAQAADGRNVFEVETDVTADARRVRPGLQGVAKLSVGRAPLGWVLFHGVADWLRLSVWSWMP